MNLKKVNEFIDGNVEEHVEKLREFLRQPSVSPENYGVRECAELLKRIFLDLGCREAEVVETTDDSGAEGNPVVYGRYDAGAERTLAVYMMYDTMPVTGETGWISPPFEARVVEVEGIGRCIIARGAVNTKGPLRAFLNAVESIREVGEELPVNLKFTAEGSEELGSRHFTSFLTRYKEKLADVDAVYFPSAAMDLKGKVDLGLGNKGMAYMELTCSGGSWGEGRGSSTSTAATRPGSTARSGG